MLKTHLYRNIKLYYLNNAVSFKRYDMILYDMILYDMILCDMI